MTSGGPAGECKVRLRSGADVQAPWAQIHGPWLTYVDSEGRCHSVHADRVADIEWS